MVAGVSAGCRQQVTPAAFWTVVSLDAARMMDVSELVTLVNSDESWVFRLEYRCLLCLGCLPRSHHHPCVLSLPRQEVRAARRTWIIKHRVAAASVLLCNTTRAVAFFTVWRAYRGRLCPVCVPAPPGVFLPGKVRLCDPCARKCPCVLCVPCVSRLPASPRCLTGVPRRDA